MKEIRVGRFAETDLDRIWSYIASKSASVEIANDVVDSIVTGFSLLAQTPKAGLGREELGSDVRGLPIGSHIVYYRETEKLVVVARVLHGMRDQAVAYWKT
jgi:toxin ParE1/3/4